MRIKSIQTKYILLVLCCVIISGVLIGGICLSNATRNSMREAAQNMNLTCESYKYKYDASLINVQNAVEATAAFGADKLDSIERFANEEEYRDAFAARLEDALSLEAGNIDIVMSYYARFSPELLSFDKGFRFVRSQKSGGFEKVRVVKIQDYQESDDQYVGWYYTPIKNGTTTWMEPYYNANFKKSIVSCITPFYKDKELVGVIGIDIDFTTLINDLQDLRIFDNGYAFLCSSEGKVYYHHLYEAGTYIQQDVSGFDAQLENESSGEELYNGISDGKKIEYAFRTLTNDMRLVLRAPESEINAETNSLASVVVVVVFAVIVLSILATVLICRRITKPLRSLTEAAERMSEGDYDISLEDIQSKDEVGVLAHTLQTSAVELKGYVERMKQMAYKDALTGVRNKTAYNIEVDVLESEIANDCAEFGIAVFDINNLKTANDEFGHEQGDKVIKAGCNRICTTFPRCPVFRIGGDEFVVVLKGEDLARVEDRMQEFSVRSERENASVTDDKDIVSVAVGIAVYNKKLDSCVQDVFNRADAAMYSNKQNMKEKTPKRQ